MGGLTFYIADRIVHKRSLVGSYGLLLQVVDPIYEIKYDNKPQ